MRIRWLLVLSCLALALPAAAGDAVGSGDAGSPPKVRLDLVARSIDGGVRLGLRYRIAPGWHIYWENPGESGMATSAQASVPQGWVAEPLAFPGPSAFGVEVVGYGYSEQVVLFMDLMGSGEGSVRVDSRWLVCRELCEQESASAELLLSDVAATSPAMEAFEAQLPRIPVPSDGVQVSASGSSLEVTVRDASKVTLFPGLALEAALGGGRPSFLREEIVNSGAIHVLRANVSGSLSDDPAHGVLRIDRANGTSFLALRVPRPASESP